MARIYVDLGSYGLNAIEKELETDSRVVFVVDGCKFEATIEQTTPSSPEQLIIRTVDLTRDHMAIFPQTGNVVAIMPVEF